MEINGNGHKLALDSCGTPISHLPRPAVAKARPLAQLVALQARLVKEALDSETPAKDVAACACAFSRLEDQRQVLTGHGRPKPVEARNNQPKRTRSKPATWTEPEPANPVAPVLQSEQPKPTEPLS